MGESTELLSRPLLRIRSLREARCCSLGIAASPVVCDCEESTNESTDLLDVPERSSVSASPYDHARWFRGSISCVIQHLYATLHWPAT